MTTTTIHDRRAANGSRACNAPHCYHPRRGLSAFCAGHERKRNIYGHPEGRPIRRKDYEVERIDVAQFIARNTEHPAIVNAVETFAGLMIDAAAGKPGVAAVDFSRLHTAGVTGNDCLVETAALWLYSIHRPRALVDDVRITYALGTALLHLAPRYSHRAWTAKGMVRRYKRHPGQRRLRLGQFVRESFGLLFMRFADAIHEDQQRCNERKLKMRAPFKGTASE